MNTYEKIIEDWLRICKKQFTILNISFKVPRNYSDIDILSTDGHGNFYDYEVKYRDSASIGATDKEKPEYLISQLNRKEREVAVKMFTKGKDYQRFFLTTKAIFGNKRKEEYLSLFAKAGIEVIYFEEVIDDLIEVEGRFDSPFFQTIKLLKKFNKIRTDADNYG